MYRLVYIYEQKLFLWELWEGKHIWTYFVYDYIYLYMKKFFPVFYVFYDGTQNFNIYLSSRSRESFIYLMSIIRNSIGYRVIFRARWFTLHSLDDNYQNVRHALAFTSEILRLQISNRVGSEPLPRFHQTTIQPRELGPTSHRRVLPSYIYMYVYTCGYTWYIRLRASWLRWPATSRSRSRASAQAVA